MHLTISEEYSLPKRKILKKTFNFVKHIRMYKPQIEQGLFFLYEEPDLIRIVLF